MEQLVHSQVNSPGIFRKFMEFSKGQQPNLFAWVGSAFFIQGCIISPLTVLAIVINGNYIGLWIPCMAAFAITEVVMLSAQPTRISIPVFVGGILVDLMVIVLSFLIHFAKIAGNSL
jgi:hypothetical protein